MTDADYNVGMSLYRVRKYGCLSLIIGISEALTYFGKKVSLFETEIRGLT
jgi:hypothetical protein